MVGKMSSTTHLSWHRRPANHPTPRLRPLHPGRMPPRRRGKWRARVSGRFSMGSCRRRATNSRQLKNCTVGRETLELQMRCRALAQRFWTSSMPRLGPPNSPPPLPSPLQHPLQLPLHHHRPTRQPQRDRVAPSSRQLQPGIPLPQPQALSQSTLSQWQRTSCPHLPPLRAPHDPPTTPHPRLLSRPPRIRLQHTRAHCPPPRGQEGQGSRKGWGICGWNRAALRTSSTSLHQHSSITHTSSRSRRLLRRIYRSTSCHSHSSSRLDCAGWGLRFSPMSLVRT
mmetsp:Transcript_18303/g.42259  ORF Transcript_18303/g.42259 Transcript_18303/m.42259 type:complete len:282 (-) Transcript_18303:446-1291(-)